MKFLKFFCLGLFVSLILGCTAKYQSTGSGNRSKQGNLDSQLENLTEQIVLSLSQKQKSKIAVIEFSDLNGDISEFGRYLAEELITRLYLTNKFEVIERQLLNKVLSEHQLNMTGMIDPTSAQELGKLLGVDAIASGSVTDLGSSVKVNARLISTETGQIFSVASVEIVKDDAVVKLMGGTVVTSTASMSAPSKSEKSKMKKKQVKKNGFIIELVNCELSGKSLTCFLKITNTTSGDKDFAVRYGGYSSIETKIFDDFGNEYRIKAVKIANQEYKFDGRSYLHRLTKKIIPDVPVNAELYFEGVSPEATKITLLQINCHEFEIEFRKIPIQKEGF